MKFIETKIKGVYLIELEKKEDERGFLARTWDVNEFKKNGIDFNILQGYITSSIKKGTIRGFHYLTIPEKKLTKVSKGSVYPKRHRLQNALCGVRYCSRNIDT